MQDSKHSETVCAIVVFLFQLCQEGDAMLTPLRIGHTSLTHDHLLRGEPAAYCINVMSHFYGATHPRELPNL